MKIVNRKRAMYVCLIILIVMLFESLTGNLFLYFDVLTFVFGLVVGWAFRETFSPKQEETEE